LPFSQRTALVVADSPPQPCFLDELIDAANIEVPDKSGREKNDRYRYNEGDNKLPLHRRYLLSTGIEK